MWKDESNFVFFLHHINKKLTSEHANKYINDLNKY